jgi:hypothetical protein
MFRARLRARTKRHRLEIVQPCDAEGAMRGVIMKNVVRKVLVLSAIGTAVALGGCATSSPPPPPPPPPPQAMDQTTTTTSQDNYTAPAAEQQTTHRGPRG